MTNSNDKRNERRLIILKGLNDGLSKERIAEELGVHPRIVRRDLTRMHRRRDPELRKALSNAQEHVLAEKERIRNKAGERFKHITGMTFEEKTFENMMKFYLPEIRKIMRSKKQDVAIRALPGSVVKTLKRNGIIVQGRKTPHVTSKAMTHLANRRFNV